jgi:hypothetical protein
VNYFVLAVAALEAAAGVQYAVEGKWHLAVSWACYAVACVAFALDGARS